MAKSKVSRECLDAAAEALSLFTDSELNQYVVDVLRKAKSYEDLHGMAAIDKAQKEINDEAMKSLYAETKTKADNIVKVDNIASQLKDGKKTLRNFLLKRYEGLGQTLSGFKKSAQTRLEQASISKMTTEQWDFVRDKKNHIDIYRALSGKSATAMAKGVASFVDKYLDTRTTEMVNSGALPLEYINDDRFFRNIHDKSKILAGGRSLIDSARSRFKYDPQIGKPVWKEYIKSRLDLEGTFAHTDAMGADGKLIDSEVDRLLDDIFDNITQGKSDIFTKSRVVNGREEILKKRRMFFKFKDWETWGEYNEKYGTGDLFSAWESDIHGTASKVGAADLLGSSPYQAYYDLKKEQQRVSPETASWRSKGNLWYRNTDLYFQAAMGIDQSPVSPTLANFFGNLRSATSMAALPLVAVKSSSDMAYIASYAARWGMDYWKTYGYSLQHAFNVLKSEDRQYIAKLFMGLSKSELGYIGRFTDSHNSSEIMKKANMAYYRGIGLDGFDTGNKVGILTLMAKHLGEMSKNGWNGLNDALRLQLTKHDIGAHEWEVMRKNSEKGFFTTENITNMSDSQLKEIYEKSDKSVPLSQLKNRLYNKVHSIFDVASENAVLSPGEFERAWLFQGTAPGTLLGELVRSFAHFKAYPLAYMDRVLVNGFRDADGVQARIGWGLQMAVGTLPLSLASNYFSYLAQGLSFPDITQMSPSELIKFGLENIMGNLGVFLNVAEARNQNSGLIASQFRTLPLKLLSDALSIPFAVATGNLDAAGKAFKDASTHVLPLKTLPFISPIMEGLLNDKPYLLPQQHIIYGYGQ